MARNTKATDIGLVVAEEENVNYIQNEMQKKTVSNCASE